MCVNRIKHEASWRELPDHKPLTISETHRRNTLFKEAIELLTWKCALMSRSSLFHVNRLTDAGDAGVVAWVNWLDWLKSVQHFRKHLQVSAHCTVTWSVAMHLPHSTCRMSPVTRGTAECKLCVMCSTMATAQQTTWLWLPFTSSMHDI